MRRLAIVLLVACGAPVVAQEKPATLPSPTAAPSASASANDELKQTKSGVFYVDERIGDGASPVSVDSTITAHYVVTNADGEKLDSSYDRGRPITVPLNALIKGWQEGVLTMRVGGKRRLIVPPDLAYGSGPGKMKGTLTFEIELLGVEDAQ